MPSGAWIRNRPESSSVTEKPSLGASCLVKFDYPLGGVAYFLGVTALKLIAVSSLLVLAQSC